MKKVNELYPEKSYSDAVDFLKKRKSTPVQLTEKEYEIIVNAKKSGNYEEVYQTDIYKSKTGEYGYLLEFLPNHKAKLAFVKDIFSGYAVFNKERIVNGAIKRIATITADKQILSDTQNYPEEIKEIQYQLKKNLFKKYLPEYLK